MISSGGNHADEDVGEDQLAAHAPQQLPPHAHEQPPRESTATETISADRRDAADDLDEAGDVGQAPPDGDDQLERGRGEEEPPRPGVEDQRARRKRGRRLGRQRQRRREQPARAADGLVRESWAAHAKWIA